MWSSTSQVNGEFNCLRVCLHTDRLWDTHTLFVFSREITINKKKTFLFWWSSLKQFHWISLSFTKSNRILYGGLCSTVWIVCVCVRSDCERTWSFEIEDDFLIMKISNIHWSVVRFRGRSLMHFQELEQYFELEFDFTIQRRLTNRFSIERVKKKLNLQFLVTNFDNCFLFYRAFRAPVI